MRAHSMLRAAVAAFVLLPIVAVPGTALAASSASPSSAPASQTSDTSLAASADSAAAAPTFSGSGENQLAADFRSHKLTAKQFVTFGLGKTLGAALPAVYKDDAEAAVASPAAPSASLSSSQDSAAGGDSAMPAGGWDADFTNYLFAVAGTLPAQDQAAFAQAFNPAAADGSDPTPVYPADGAAPQTTSLTTAQSPIATSAATSAAGPAMAAPQAAATATNSFCQYPVVVGLPQTIQFGFPHIRRLSYQCTVNFQHFTIRYTLASHDQKNGVPDTDAFGLVHTNNGWVRTLGSDGLPDYIDNVAMSMENAYAYYISRGYSRPQHFTTVLISSAPSGNFTPPPIAGLQFIALRNDSPQIVVPFHEVFHTFQYRYLSNFDLLNYTSTINWWMEATAVWASHHAMVDSGQSLIDTNGDNEGHAYADKLQNYLAAPSQSLDAWAGFAGDRQYGAFIFAEYLSGRFGDDAILSTWQHIGDGHLPVDAIKRTFTDYSTTAAVEMPKYAKAVYQLGSDVGTTTTICLPDYYGGNALDGTGGCPAGQYPQSVQIGGSGYSSNQFQFTDPDLSYWIDILKRNSKTDAHRPADPAQFKARPFHDIARINGSTLIAAHDSTIGPGGMAFTDVIWNGTLNKQLKITITAPKTYQSLPHGGRQPVPIGLHASLIGWTSYRQRCGVDQEAVITQADVPTTVTFPSLSGCTFVTLVLTDVLVQTPGAAFHIDYGWDGRVTPVAGPVPT